VDEGYATPEWLRRATDRIDIWFTVAATIVIDLMALASLIALIFSAWGVAQKLYLAIAHNEGNELTAVIVEILTVFILVEVLAVSMRFLRANRIDVRDLIDVTLAIIFREIWVGMFSGALHWQELFALSALVIACGGVRIALGRDEMKIKFLNTASAESRDATG
jgi:uncharacterized membrane protein (DUF373 family)